MFIKKFFVVMAVLLSVSLFLIGCEGPVGPAGATGGLGDTGATPDSLVPVNSSAVTKGELATIFARDGVKTVVLLNGVTSVEGLVPAGKTLVVAEGSAGIAVKDDSFLDVQGALEIPQGVVLDASYINAASGYLKVTAAGSASTYGTALQAASAEPKSGISGGGRIKLPFVAGGSLPPGAVSYANLKEFTGGSAVAPVVGSFRDETADANTAGSALSVDDIKALFALGDAKPELPEDGALEISSPLTNIDAQTVPAGAKLKLTAKGNVAPAALDLSTAGELIVAAGADLQVTGSIKGNTAANIIVEGALILTGNAFEVKQGVDLANAEIDASSLEAAATLTMPTGALEVRSIKNISSSSTLDLSITGPTSLTVKEIIPGAEGVGGVKSTTINTYTAGAHSVSLAKVSSSVSLPPISEIKNNVFTIEVGDSDGAVVIGSPLSFTGDAKIRVHGANGISVTGIATAASGSDAEVPAVLQLTTANLGHFTAVDGETASKITVSDAATGIAETLVIPKGVDVTAATATLTAIDGLTVNGSLTAAAASLGSATDITIGDGGSFTTASTAIGLPSNAALKVGNNATVSATGDTATWVNLASIDIGTGSTVTLSGAATTLAGVASITVGKGSTLTTGAGLTLAAIASSAITGDGKIVAADISTSTTAVQKLIESKVATVELAQAGYAVSGSTITIPQSVTRVFTGAFAPTGGNIAVEGKLIAQGGLTLATSATIGSNGELIVPADKSITLGAADAKILGTSYEITYGTATGGTIGAANVSGTAVMFQKDAIIGVSTAEADNGKALSSLETPTTAAVLVFGSKDSVLTVKGATTVDGVIIDVATNGKVTVSNAQTLTLKYSAAADGAASGGIFTAAISSGSSATAVKANAATVKSSSGAIDGASTLAGSKLEVVAESDIKENGNLGAVGAIEDGKITGSGDDGTTVEKGGTFTVSGAAITATPAST